MTARAQRVRQHRKHSVVAAVGLGLCVCASNCAVGPNYKRPELPTIPKYRGQDLVSYSSDGKAPLFAASVADLPWWQLFEDPYLIELIGDSIEHNYDARIALARVQQAKAALGVAESDFFPQIGYSVEGGRGQRTFLGSPNTAVGEPSNSMAGYGGVSWQIDLWGKIRRQTEQARALLLGTEYARRGVMLSVLGSVATQYYRLLQLDKQLEVAEHTVKAYEQVYNLFHRRQVGGWASALETEAAAAQLHSVAAQVPQLRQEIKARENALSILVGRVPGPIKRSSQLIDRDLPVAVPAGLPSDLVQRRPDLLESEQQLVAATAAIGVAIANYFPDLSLTGLLGVVSPQLSKVVDGDATMWGVFGTLAGPIFTFGKLEGEKAQAEALAKQATLDFQLAVLTAYGEVSDSLYARKNLEVAYDQQYQSVAALKLAVEMATKRYIVGISSYYEVLQELELLYPAQLELATLNSLRYINIVNIYLSLGGGWRIPTKGWAGPGQSPVPGAGASGTPAMSARPPAP